MEGAAGVLTVGMRRLHHHRAALVVLALTALTSLLVLGTLQLLSRVVTDRAAEGALVAAPVAERTISAVRSVDKDEVAAARDVVAQAQAAVPGSRLSEVFEAISRGIEGRDPTDRAGLAVLADLPRWTTLAAGAWPVAGSDPIQVVLPEAAAAAGGWQVGDRMDLPDLITDNAPPLHVVVTGIVTAKDPLDAVWLDLPLAQTGTRTGAGFTSYGPFFADGGDLETVIPAATARWRIALPSTGLTRALAPVRQGQVEYATRLLTESPDLKGAQVRTDAPQLYAEASLISERTRIALLTPTILLMLLGSVALTMAGLQLAGLRAQETQLLRSRGASTSQIVGLAAIDAGMIAIGAFVVAWLTVPLLARPLARLGGLDIPTPAWSDAIRWRGLVLPLLVAALAAAAIVAITAARSGQLRLATQRSRRGQLLARLAGAGLDLVLIGFGVLGLLQLRRYDVTTPRADPLTLAAPALVLAGLAVLGLRLIPWLARVAAAAAGRRSGLTLAWGSWQVARRLAGQAGAILLIFLSVAMGALGVAQAATLGRAISDQTHFAAGSPLRVTTGSELTGKAGLRERYAAIAGGTDRVMAAHVGSIGVGSAKEVTMLAVDTHAAGVAFTPRADVAPDWQRTLEKLAVPVAGLDIPAGARELAAHVQFELDEQFEWAMLPARPDFLVALADGEWIQVPGERVTSSGSVRLRADLPQVVGGWPAGTRLIGITMAPASTYLPPEAVASAGLASADPAAPVRLDGVDMRVAGKPEPDRWIGGALFLPLGDHPAPAPVPVLVTRDLLTEARLDAGRDFSIEVSGTAVPVHVVSVVDAIPGVPTPRRALMLHLEALADPQQPGQENLGPPVAQQWWLAPADVAAARAALAKEPRLATALVDQEEVEEQRRANPVNAGMRAALRLVTASALVLASLGFAAATAGLALARHREGAILLALGTPPGHIRRAVVGERLVVLVLASLIGVLAGLAAARVIVPLVVGSDGYEQIPPVAVDLDVLRLLVFVGVVLAVLALISILVIGRTARDLADVLRAGERE